MSIIEDIQRNSPNIKNRSLILKAFGEELFEKSRTGVYSNTAENRRLKRVGQKYGSKKVEEQGPDRKLKEKDKEKEKPQKSLDEHARATSQQALENAVKNHKDEEVRKAAHKELERRKKEEYPQEEKKDGKKVEQKKDEVIEDQYKPFNKKESVEYYQNNQSNMDDFDDYKTIADYKFRGYLGMNEGLRQGNEKKLKEYEDRISRLSNFISKNKIKHDIVLYRKVKTNFFKDLKAGTIIKDKGFSSASLKKDFDKFNSFGDNDIEIRCPKGSKVASLNESNLLEYCIDKDSRLKVIKNKGNKIVLELLK